MCITSIVTVSAAFSIVITLVTVQVYFCWYFLFIMDPISLTFQAFLDNCYWMSNTVRVFFGHWIFLRFFLGADKPHTSSVMIQGLSLVTHWCRKSCVYSKVCFGPGPEVGLSWVLHTMLHEQWDFPGHYSQPSAGTRRMYSDPLMSAISYWIIKQDAHLPVWLFTPLYT